MSIERNSLKHTTRLLAALALACFVALSACVSPDLEPPGAADTTLPGKPGATERARAQDRTAKSRWPAADAGATAATSAAEPGTNMAAAGQGARPATEAMTAPKQPSAGGSGAPGVPGQPDSDDDADAGTKTP